MSRRDVCRFKEKVYELEQLVELSWPASLAPWVYEKGEAQGPICIWAAVTRAARTSDLCALGFL